MYVSLLVTLLIKAALAYEGMASIQAAVGALVVASRRVCTGGKTV
jgi:hypothetical protein